MENKTAKGRRSSASASADQQRYPLDETAHGYA